LYRHRQSSGDSEQHNYIHVESGAVLEYLPDAVIPFAGSRHQQRTSIYLAEDATLFWWDSLAPGRHAMGETFAFERLRMQTEIRSPTKPLLLDDFVLEPAIRPLASTARLGIYTHMASFYACKVGVAPPVWRELESKLNTLCVAYSHPGAMIWGATTLVADGLAVRGLSVSACDIPATLHSCWDIARRFLTGKKAIPPRKVY
jgi:urease accessory protein